ncbi:RNA polymerase II subunit A C-terminal domain phosphatase [Pelomyxa schiedti]|nr:RNA polymerase II subunit A C-terminal domain phosphatase [Pelomyxa schiedti]
MSGPPKAIPDADNSKSTSSPSPSSTAAPRKPPTAPLKAAAATSTATTTNTTTTSSTASKTTTNGRRVVVRKPSSPPTTSAGRGSAAAVKCAHDGVIFDGICCACGTVVEATPSVGFGLGLSNVMSGAQVRDRVSLPNGLSVPARVANRLKTDTTHSMLTEGRLALVCDLDQTLIHATMGVPFEGDGCFSFTLPEQPRVKYSVKQRPGLKDFLKSARKLYEVYLYTMGIRSYALKICEHIDPKHKTFKHRIISKDDTPETFAEEGQLKLLKQFFPSMGDDSMVVVVDDTPDVWKNSPNLLQIEKFTYFPEPTDPFGSALPPDALAPNPDAIKDDHLSHMLTKLNRIHHSFYSKPGPRDVRTIIDQLRKRVLEDVCIVFSGVIPLDYPDPIMHPLWTQAESCGAKCCTSFDTTARNVTHVIAARSGTDKVTTALDEPVYLVHVEWLREAFKRWLKPREQEFPLENLPVFPQRFIRAGITAPTTNLEPESKRRRVPEPAHHWCTGKLLTPAPETVPAPVTAPKPKPPPDQAEQGSDEDSAQEEKEDSDSNAEQGQYEGNSSGTDGNSDEEDEDHSPIEGVTEEELGELLDH